MSTSGLKICNNPKTVEVTINGIGERAGNTSLEEVAMILNTHKLGYETRINTTKIYPLSMLVSKMMRMPIQPNKAIVGRNAFAHSSGIHQDGVLKHRDNYEIIAPETVGVPKNSIILTARSGRHALKYHLERLGFEQTTQELSETYEEFLLMADGKKDVTDDDLLQLMKGTAKTGKIELDHLQVTCGESLTPTATVHLKNGR